MMENDKRMTATSSCGGQALPQPPQYFMSSNSSYGDPACGYGAAPAYQHQQQSVPLMHAASGHPQTVVVSQPVYMGGQQAPSTTCALVFATISAIFCGFWCGTASIIFAWKARMQVLSRKTMHARHTLNIAWIFLFLSMVFGLLIWGFVGFYYYLILNMK